MSSKLGFPVAKRKLTTKQRELVAEIRRLLSTLALDPERIIADAEPKARTAYLEAAKDQIIRSEIILKYVLMDEHLSAVICWHFFGKKRSFIELWKTKRFKSFNYFVLEKLSLLNKLDLVRSIHDIPNRVSSDLSALNDLRNGIAHSFFPQNRRRKPKWKGQNVFTLAGFERFLEDVEELSAFFVDHFWRGSPDDTQDRPDAALPVETVSDAGGGTAGRMNSVGEAPAKPSPQAS